MPGENKGKDSTIKILIAVLLITVNLLVGAMIWIGNIRHESYLSWQQEVKVELKEASEERRRLSDRSIMAAGERQNLIEDLTKVEERIKP